MYLITLDFNILVILTQKINNSILKCISKYDNLVRFNEIIFGGINLLHYNYVCDRCIKISI